MGVSARQREYFSPAGIHVFAHRGYAAGKFTENTWAAFDAALAAGATHIESDVHATSDGIAVLAHDSDLSRVAGDSRTIAQLTWAEVSKIDLGSGGIPTLADTLAKYTKARFNLDIKDASAIESTVKAIEQAAAESRVLVSSFSGSTRRKALSLFSHGSVVTSADSSLVLRLWLACLMRRLARFKALAEGCQALQIPTHFGPIRLDSPRFIRFAHEAGMVVDYWTINDVAEIRRLVARGADGIVTDDTALAVATLANL